MKLKEIVKNKTVVWSVVALFVGMMFGGNSTCTDSNHTESVAKVSELQTEVENKSKEIETLNAKIESAKPWFDMKAEEQKAIEEENARLKAEEEAKKKAEEEEAKRLAEEEAKKGYDTGITYNQIARTPDEYKGKKIKFKALTQCNLSRNLKEMRQLHRDPGEGGPGRGRAARRCGLCETQPGGGRGGSKAPRGHRESRGPGWAGPERPLHGLWLGILQQDHG